MMGTLVVKGLSYLSQFLDVSGALEFMLNTSLYIDLFCTLHYILNVQTFYHRLEVMKQVCNFSQAVYFFSYVWAQRWLFCSEVGKLLSPKIICKGLQIALSNTYFIVTMSFTRI